MTNTTRQCLDQDYRAGHTAMDLCAQVSAWRVRFFTLLGVLAALVIGDLVLLAGFAWLGGAR